MRSIIIQMNADEAELFNSYAKEVGESLPSLLKKSLFREAEDQMDLKDYHDAYKDYLRNPKTISHTELKQELGF